MSTKLSSKIKPVAGYVVVEPQKKQRTTASGIVLPDSHDDKPQQGVIVAVGAAAFQDGQKIEAPCKIGDQVIYREWGGKEFKEDNEEVLILKFDDIMAVIKNP